MKNNMSFDVKSNCFLIVFILFFFSFSACSNLSTSLKRRDLLENALQNFHISFITQNIPAILLYMPPEERTRYETTFRCLFNRIRFENYAIETVQTGGDLKEAKVSVTMSGNRLDALTIQAFIWKEIWTYKENRWSVVFDSYDLKKNFQDCLAGAPQN